MSYAQGTKVRASKSREEILTLLERAKCTSTGVGQETGHALVYFQRDGWQVQIRVRLPGPADAPPGSRGARWRSKTQLQKEAWAEQTTREKWRQLLLVLKAKFTALDEGIETFEQCFMAHLVLGGRVVGDALLPHLNRARELGEGMETAARRMALPPGDLQ